jgi:hypothetical protein
VPSTRAGGSSVRLIAALFLGIALGAAAGLLLRTPEVPSRRTAARASSPDRSRIALAYEQRCAAGWCQALLIGASEESATEVTTLSNQSCDEIAWTPDGSRVGFLIDGVQLWLYDAKALKPIGPVNLFTPEAIQSRVARGVTFSENGRAVTFDDCPRGHSGCRAGLMGIGGR